MSIFHIEQQSRVPIYEQLGRQVLSFVASGVLKENQQMPSVRQLAADLGINPNTVQKAYRELEREGLIYSVPGKGSFIATAKDHISYICNRLVQEMKDLIKGGLLSDFSEADLRKIFDQAYRAARQEINPGPAQEEARIES